MFYYHNCFRILFLRYSWLQNRVKEKYKTESGDWGTKRERERKDLEETVRALGGEPDKMIKQDKMVHTYLSDTYGKGIIPNI